MPHGTLSLTILPAGSAGTVEGCAVAPSKGPHDWFTIAMIYWHPMEGKKRYRWLWRLAQIAIIYGLLWLHSVLHPHEKFSWVILVIVALVLEWFVAPALGEWIKNLVKQAMREKQLEDDEDAQEQALDDSD